MANRVYDGRMKHPFTCVVAGPSGSGKSTFVRSLLSAQGEQTTVVFDYVIIFLGTDASENKTLSTLGSTLTQRVFLLEMRHIYPTTEDMKRRFPSDLKNMLKSRSDKGLKGCLVFDDLMEELSHCGVLSKLFSKYSTHYDVSIINITQNLFHQGAGKHRSDHTTVYRNTRVLVLFNNPIDNSVLTTVGKRLKPSGSSPLIDMMNDIVQKHRYVIIHADMSRPSELKFTSDIFARTPVPHQRVFQLRDDNDDSDDEG